MQYTTYTCSCGTRFTLNSPTNAQDWEFLGRFPQFFMDLRIRNYPVDGSEILDHPRDASST